MQYSIVNLSKVDLGNRIDAEYYKPIYLELEKKLICVGKSLSIFLKQVNCGPFGSTIKCETYLKQGVIVARPFNINNYQFELDNIVFIEKKDCKDKNLKFYLPEDIFFSRVGDIRVGIVPQIESDFTISPNIIAVRVDRKKISPYYVVLFFNSKYGYLQIERNLKIVAQPTISTDIIQNLIIIDATNEFQEFIENYFKKSIDLKNQSIGFYHEAQTLLLSELGLLNWNPKHHLSFIKNFSDTHSSERFDAEYYQPKYAELLEIIENYSQYTCRISSIQNYNARGLQPVYSPDGTLNVISSRHILETSLDYENFERTNSSNWVDQRRARVYEGDILTYTTGANIGRTAVYSSNRPALASNHVNILRIENENPEYVGFVMNSIVGRLQTERLSAGSAQAELYPKDIGSFVIPFIALNKQKEIIERISQSRLMKHKSKSILESAKKAVEKAIEEDEETAMQWLKSQIDSK